jgi:hypothetical protein
MKTPNPHPSIRQLQQMKKVKIGTKSFQKICERKSKRKSDPRKWKISIFRPDPGKPFNRSISRKATGKKGRAGRSVRKKLTSQEDRVAKVKKATKKDLGNEGGHLWPTENESKILQTSRYV